MPEMHVMGKSGTFELMPQAVNPTAAKLRTERAFYAKVAVVALLAFAFIVACIVTHGALLTVFIPLVLKKIVMIAAAVIGGMGGGAGALVLGIIAAMGCFGIGLYSYMEWRRLRAELHALETRQTKASMQGISLE